MNTTCLQTNEQAVQLRPSQLANAFLCNLCTYITLQVVISRAGVLVRWCDWCPLAVYAEMLPGYCWMYIQAAEVQNLSFPLSSLYRVTVLKQMGKGQKLPPL